MTLADRSSDLLVGEIDGLREAVRQTRAERPFQIDAWVVLPDQLHCIWTLPEGDTDYSTRWGAIKGRFSIAVRRAGFTRPNQLPNVKTGRYAGVNPGLRAHCTWTKYRVAWLHRLAQQIEVGSGFVSFEHENSAANWQRHCLTPRRARFFPAFTLPFTLRL